MLLRRIIEHLRTQNWIAVWLDLLIVIVGILIAFQIERWAESRRSQEAEIGHLQALEQDFAASQPDIERVITRHSQVVSAVNRILELGNSDPASASVEEFRKLLADVQWLSSFEPRRVAYDLLVSTGQIDAISNAQLRSEVASFYAEADGEAEQIKESMNLYVSMTWEPYIIRNMNAAALAKISHPEGLAAKYPDSEYTDHLELIGNREFENVVIAKWHISYDYLRVLNRLLELLEDIQNSLGTELARHSSKE